MKIIDCHNDFFTAIKNNKERIEYLKQCKKQGVEIIFASLYTTELKNPIKKLNQIKKFINKNKSGVKLILHIEDLGFVTKENINFVIEAKPFSVGLTWNYKNSLASGALDEGGLTAFGNDVIKKLEENNILIDTAHLNEQSFNEFVNFTTKPIFNSHSAFFDFYKHKRNLNNNQIKQIIYSNGLICLTFVGAFLSINQTSIKTVAGIIKYFIDKFGDSNLAIGTDFYGTKDLPLGLVNYSHFKKLKALMVKNGISVASIEKVFYYNAKAFLNH